MVVDVDLAIQGGVAIQVAMARAIRVGRPEGVTADDVISALAALVEEHAGVSTFREIGSNETA